MKGPYDEVSQVATSDVVVGHHRAVFADKMDRHRRSGRHQQGDRGKAFKVNDPRKLIAASAGARKLIRERPDERPFGP